MRKKWGGKRRKLLERKGGMEVRIKLIWENKAKLSFWSSFINREIGEKKREREKTIIPKVKRRKKQETFPSR